MKTPIDLLFLRIRWLVRALHHLSFSSLFSHLCQKIIIVKMFDSSSDEKDEKKEKEHKPEIPLQENDISVSRRHTSQSSGSRDFSG